jgi:integrase
MRHSLDAIASLLSNGECDALTLDWSKLRYQHTAAIRAALKQRLAPATANKMLVALRRVLTEARKLDLIDAEAYAQAVDIPSIKQSGKLRGRALTASEITALMEVCQPEEGAIALRDLALIAILRGGGIRRTEVVALQLRDFQRSTGALEIRDGKGNQDRMVYLPEGASARVEEWLEVRGEEPGSLLCPVRKGGKVQLRQMHSDAVLKIVRRRAQQAGIESFSPHDFRRTFCSDLLDSGVDIVTVQKLAGHASPVTTAKYDRRGEETKRRAVQWLEMPE